uniref:SFRICE_032633 n=1 Tax=Spodoptera frugiperda TaxID=7108 RepID=A0A2H1WPX7_SPOFR
MSDSSGISLYSKKNRETILLGDSGVGKTSLLVQFETGKFQAGNFSATVGIGFTFNVTAYLIASIFVCYMATGPGFTALTLTPDEASSKAATRVKVSIPALEAHFLGSFFTTVYYHNVSSFFSKE